MSIKRLVAAGYCLFFIVVIAIVFSVLRSFAGVISVAVVVVGKKPPRIPSATWNRFDSEYAEFLKGYYFYPRLCEVLVPYPFAC